MIVSNQLPIRARREGNAWEFEWDEDALVAQAKAGLPEEYDVVYVGGLSVDVDVMEQEEVAAALKAQHNCAPVFIAPELKDKYYKGALCSGLEWWRWFVFGGGRDGRRRCSLFALFFFARFC